MTSSEKNQQDLETLQFIAQKLQEDDIETRLLPIESTQLPLNILSVPTQHEQTGEMYHLMLSFYPIEEDQIEGNRYLQIFMQFETAIKEEAVPQLLMLLPEVNQKTPIGHFGYQYDEGKAYYRYVLMVGKHEPDLYTKIAELQGYLPFIFSLLTPSLQILQQGFADITA